MTFHNVVWQTRNYYKHVWKEDRRWTIFYGFILSVILKTLKFGCMLLSLRAKANREMHNFNDNFSFLNQSVLLLHLVVSWRCHSSWRMHTGISDFSFFQSFEQKRPLNFYIAGKQKVDCLASSTLVKTSWRKTMQAHVSLHQGIQEELNCRV